MTNKVWSYLRKDKKNIAGWLQRIDAEIIGSIFEFQNCQNITGSCVEIGVHQGKSFIPLCMSLRKEELALCVDIFDDQSKNLDNSGKGDFRALKSNLDKFNLDLSKIRIFKGSSQEVSPDYILQQVGPVRFFSIDGGHWKSIVQNDLQLAEKTLAKNGVIALDDYYRAQWPEVTAGYVLWQETTVSDIIPFAVGSNKLYLCHKDYATLYREALKTDFLKHYFTKTCKTEKSAIDCYRVDPYRQDETDTKSVLSMALKIFRPDIFIALRTRIF